MKRAVFTLSVFFAGLTLAAQNPTALRFDVRLVNVVATVTDEIGRHVSNLTANDFTILDDGVPQKITHFTQDYDVAVSVGILLDISGSMQGKMSAATEAVDRFLNRVHEDDDIFLMTFARDVHLRQDFTSDRGKLSRALNGITISGGTVLYDALQSGLDKIREGRHDKRAILVISDGVDAGSRRVKLPELLNSIRGAEVLVYGLGTAPTVYADPDEHVPFSLPTPRSTARGPLPVTNPRRGAANRGMPAPTGATAVNMTVMKQFAENSGGQAYLLTDTFIDTDGPEIDRVLTSIAAELRAQYTLGYYPSAPDNGKYHTIQVKTRGGHQVRTRSGYVAK
jgi:Ca-activated chloride channel homolog